MDHHYVPVFYLKKWISCQNTKRIPAYIVEHKKFIKNLIAPKSVCHKPDLFKLDGVRHEKEFCIETEHYKVIDNEASKILKKIIENGLIFLTQMEKKWCEFILSLIFRHPDSMRIAKKHANTIAQQDISLFHPSLPKLETKKNIESNLAVYTTAEFSMDNEFSKKNKDALLKMKWWIEDFKNIPFSLLTSDFPVQFLPIDELFNIKITRYYQKPETLHDLIFGGKYLIGIPLTPKIYFFAFYGKWVNDLNNTKTVKMLNNFMVSKPITRCIYSSDNKHYSFIKKRLERKFLTIT